MPDHSSGLLYVSIIEDDQALRQGLGGRDKGAMIRVFEELLGVEVRAATGKGKDA